MSTIVSGNDGRFLQALDNFLSPNIRAIDDHPMDIGAGWTNRSSGVVIQVQNGDNIIKFDQNNHGGAGIATTPTIVSDGTISSNIMLPSAGDPTGTSFGGLVFRYVNNNNFTLILITTNGGGRVAIYEVIGGTFFERQGVNMAVSQDVFHTLSATINGNKADVLYDGATGPTFTGLTLNPSGTTHGIAYGGANVSDFGYHKGQFKITTP